MFSASPGTFRTEAGSEGFPGDRSGPAAEVAAGGSPVLVAYNDGVAGDIGL